MATLANPSSPSCLQLRLGHRCVDSSLVPFKIRLRPSVGSARLVSADGGGVRPCIRTSAYLGSSSGWSESGDDGDSGKNDRFGGIWETYSLRKKIAELRDQDIVPFKDFITLDITSRHCIAYLSICIALTKCNCGTDLPWFFVNLIAEIYRGAGLACVLFAAGVTFAWLSLSTRTSRGAKQQMEPLTREQEVILTSDDQGQDGKESNIVLVDNESKAIDVDSESGTALQVTPGIVSAVVDQVQGQMLAALQVLKVIEAEVQPGDLCTRREYARWLVSASSALSRSTIAKVYPAMYIENVTELAFDDVTPDDPDFSFIQGLAETGVISSKLSRSDLNDSFRGHQDSFLFSPESLLSRQDLVSWKMGIERRKLPEVDKNYLYKCSGYIDIDKIDPNAWPALVADLSSGEQGIMVLAFGYTRLFQPNNPVTKAQAAIALATGDAADVVGEELTWIEAEPLAETAVDDHAALIAQVENDLNASFEKELTKAREKIDAVEKLAEEARVELERLTTEREENNDVLIRGRAAVESEKEILSRLRHEVEEYLQDLMSSRIQISLEKDTINKLQKETESENQVIIQLQYELEVERKALSMARTWAEEEAKRVRERTRALEEIRERWERHGIRVAVDGDLQDDNTGNQLPRDEMVIRAEKLVEKLKEMASELKLRSSAVTEREIQKIVSLITAVKQHIGEASELALGHDSIVLSNVSRSIEEIKETASGFSSSISYRARRAVEDCKGIVDKLTQKFKA